jgi:hypothetical protein
MDWALRRCARNFRSEKKHIQCTLPLSSVARHPAYFFLAGSSVLTCQLRRLDIPCLGGEAPKSSEVPRLLHQSCASCVLCHIPVPLFLKSSSVRFFSSGFFHQSTVFGLLFHLLHFFRILFEFAELLKFEIRSALWATAG